MTQLSKLIGFLVLIALCTQSCNTATNTDKPVAVSVAQPLSSYTVELEYFFVDPEWMRRGVGSYLYLATCAYYGSQKRKRLEFYADRHARDFYHHMGARCIAMVQAETSIHPPLPFFEHWLH